LYSRSEIEYGAGGGGIYTAPSDYLILLQHLLAHQLAKTPSSELSLSASAIDSLFVGTLPDTELGRSGFAPRAKQYGLESARDFDWSTGLGILSYASGQRPLPGGRKGRSSGTAGWSGAPGIEYWIDQKEGIAVVLGSQLLPGFGIPEIEDFKVDLEALVYEALEK
jgi:CubicO group peptidase (beta-lactamase class C family)